MRRFLVPAAGLIVVGLLAFALWGPPSGSRTEPQPDGVALEPSRSGIALGPAGLDKPGDLGGQTADLAGSSQSGSPGMVLGSGSLGNRAASGGSVVSRSGAGERKAVGLAPPERSRSFKDEFELGLPPEQEWPKSAVRVVDREGAWLSGVAVQFQHPKLRRQARTGDDGRVVLRWPAGLRAQVIAMDDRFVDLRQLYESLPAELQLVLLPSASLEVRLEGRGGLLVEDLSEAEIWQWSEALPSISAERAEGATAVWTDLDPGSYSCYADHPRGVALPEFGVDLHPGERRVVHLAVTPGVSMGLRVLGADGEPVRGATVRLRRSEGNWPLPLLRSQQMEGTTDRDGRLRFGGGLEGPVTLSITRPSGALLTHALDWTADTREIELRFPPERRVRVRLMGPEGAPVADVEVRGLIAGQGGTPDMLFEKPRRSNVWAIHSDGDGWAELGDVPENRHLALVAIAPADSGWSHVWRPRAPLDSEMVLHFSRARSLSVAAQDDGGEPLEGVQVSFVVRGGGDSWRPATCFTDADGLGELRGVPPINGQLRGSKSGYVDGWSSVLADSGEAEPLVLKRTYKLSGHAVDPTGAGLRGVVIDVSRVDDGSGSLDSTPKSFRTATGGGGKFHRGGLIAGEYWVNAISELWRMRGNRPLRVSVPSEEPLALELVEASRDSRSVIVGSVVRAEDSGSIANLEVRGADGCVLLREGERFELRGVAPRKTMLMLLAPGRLPVRVVDLNPQPGQTLELGELRMDRALSVRVEVTTADGTPAIGAKVQLRPLPTSAGGPTPAAGWAATPRLTLDGDSGGLYRTSFGKAGAWRLVVEHPEHGKSVQTWKLEVPQAVGGEELETLVREVRLGS